MFYLLSYNHNHCTYINLSMYKRFISLISESRSTDWQV